MALWGCGIRTNEGGQGSPEPTEDPGNSPNGREIVTAVVTWPSRDTLEHIRAYNENSQKYFIEIREYGEESAVMEAEDLETQLTLDILSGKGHMGFRFLFPGIGIGKAYGKFVRLYGRGCGFPQRRLLWEYPAGI